MKWSLNIESSHCKKNRKRKLRAIVRRSELKSEFLRSRFSRGEENKIANWVNFYFGKNRKKKKVLKKWKVFWSFELRSRHSLEAAGRRTVDKVSVWHKWVGEKWSKEIIYLSFSCINIRQTGGGFRNIFFFRLSTWENWVQKEATRVGGFVHIMKNGILSAVKTTRK